MFHKSDLIVLNTNKKEDSQMYFAQQLLSASQVNHILITVRSTDKNFNYVIKTCFFSQNLQSENENLLYSGRELIIYLEIIAKTHQIFVLSKETLVILKQIKFQSHLEV